NRSAPIPETINSNSDVLSQLHALIESVGGLKKWTPETEREAAELLANLLFSEMAESSQQGNALSLAQDLPVPVIDSVFEKHWPGLSDDRKGGLISELMKLNSERSVKRQLAIAQRIAQYDRGSAADILEKFIGGSKKSPPEDFWPKLSKE